MIISLFYVLLGGLIAPFFVGPALAYDQNSTHPALTSEAVNFYNLNFPNNKITEREKELMIKGAIEEDTGQRPINHFYDPLRDEGWFGYRSSKVWAMSSAAQQERKNYYAVSGLLSDKISDRDPADFSYERALLDYARGDRERAFEAFGHVMHLLEDSNVPEHTRNDTHLPINHTTGSPYETAMAKWSPDNFDVAGKLYKSKNKPIILHSLNDYFNSIALYSNNYFFSEDTIFNDKYILPKVYSENVIFDRGIRFKFGMGIDKERGLFPLFRILAESNWRNVVIKTDYTLNTPIVLDGY